MASAIELQQQLSAMIGAALSGDAAAQRSVHDLNEQGAPELVPTALALAKSEGLPPPVRYFASTIVLHQARAGKLDGAAVMWQAMRTSRRPDVRKKREFLCTVARVRA